MVFKPDRCIRFETSASCGIVGQFDADLERADEADAFICPVCMHHYGGNRNG